MADETQEPASEEKQEPVSEEKQEPVFTSKELPDNHFEHKGKVYQVVVHALIIPEIGKRTAAEICVDEEAQAALVDMKSACIQEVI